MRSDTKPPSTEPLEPQFHALPIIESWSDIEVERGCAGRTETFACVEVDYVAHSVAAPVNYPVVSVKRGCVSRNAGELLRDVMQGRGRRLTLKVT